jgi:hypothetical protein
MVQFFQRLADSGARLMITTRSHLRQSLEGSREAEAVEIVAHNDDVEKYLAMRLEGETIHPILKSKIIKKINSKHQGKQAPISVL